MDWGSSYLADVGSCHAKEMKFSIQIRIGQWKLKDGKLYKWVSFKGPNSWHDWKQVLPIKKT